MQYHYLSIVVNSPLCKLGYFYIQFTMQDQIPKGAISHTRPDTFADSFSRNIRNLCGQFLMQDQIPLQTVSYTRSDTIADSFLRRFRYLCGQFLTRDQMPLRTVSHARLLSNFTQAW